MITVDSSILQDLREEIGYALDFDLRNAEANVDMVRYEVLEAKDDFIKRAKTIHYIDAIFELVKLYESRYRYTDAKRLQDVLEANGIELYYIQDTSTPEVLKRGWRLVYEDLPFMIAQAKGRR